MWYSQSENIYVREGTQFTLGGITYPAQWLNQATAEQKAEVGLQEVVYVGAPNNDKYYWVGEMWEAGTVTYVNTPKDLADVKAMRITETRNTAYSMLQPTDYIDLRNLRDPEYKLDWMMWREQVRTVASDFITAITNAEDVDTIAEMMPDWPLPPEV